MEEKIQELQMIEQNLQNFLAQKQAFQAQLMEIEAALKEISTSEKAYKIIGNIMVLAGKKELEDELSSKKEITELRLKTIERQESKLRDNASELQKEVLEEMNKK